MYIFTLLVIFLGALYGGNAQDAASTTRQSFFIYGDMIQANQLSRDYKITVLSQKLVYAIGYQMKSVCFIMPDGSNVVTATLVGTGNTGDKAYGVLIELSPADHATLVKAYLDVTGNTNNPITVTMNDDENISVATNVILVSGPADCPNGDPIPPKSYLRYIYCGELAARVPKENQFVDPTTTNYTDEDNIPIDSCGSS